MNNREWDAYKDEVRSANADKIRQSLAEQPYTMSQLAVKLNLSRYAVENAVSHLRRMGEIKSTKGKGRERNYELADNDATVTDTGVRRYRMKDDMPFIVKDATVTPMRDPLVAALFGEAA